MAKQLRFTRHAEQKFSDLAAIGFRVTREQVINTVQQPDHVDQSVEPPIAQKDIDERHLLRVVFVEEAGSIRKVRYEP